MGICEDMKILGEEAGDSASSKAVPINRALRVTSPLLASSL
jgi:hypothetical protein